MMRDLPGAWSLRHWHSKSSLTMKGERSSHESVGGGTSLLTCVAVSQFSQGWGAD